MPYIDKERRQKFKNFRLMVSHLDIDSKEELEYLVYVLMIEYMSVRENSYSPLHDCVYAVHHVADEFRRRYLDKRKDKSRQVNGDIVKNEKNNTSILRVLVGSRAHGLHNEDSDYDYRSVYVTPTEEILSLGHKYKGSTWLEGETQDNTAWEIGHFLHLATKCNPTILEVFKAPRTEEEISIDCEERTAWTFGQELRSLFPHVWNPKDCFNAFVGYGLNQRKKMLDNHLNRWEKYATAYLRTLYNLINLLDTGDFSLEVPNGVFKGNLIDIKKGNFLPGDIVNIANKLTQAAKEALEECKHEPDTDKVNEFLLRVRKKYW